MRFARASPPLRHRDGVAVLGRWKAANTANPIMLAVLRSWQCPHTSTISSRGGSPGNADWEGRKADSIGIGPVHLEWTIVDGGEKTRVPAKSRRLLRGHRDEARRGGYSALSGP